MARSVIEGLCGLKCDARGLRIAPQLPQCWPGMKIVRRFRGATFHVEVTRGSGNGVQVVCDGVVLPAGRIEGIEAGRSYTVAVLVP